MANSKSPNEPPAALGIQDEWDQLNKDDRGWAALEGETDPKVDAYVRGVVEERERIAVLTLRVFGYGEGAELFDFIKAMERAKPHDTYEQILRRDGVMDFIDWCEQHMRLARDL